MKIFHDSKSRYFRDYRPVDFRAGDGRMIYYCLRTGYYEEARDIAQSSRVANQFAPQLAEWITSGGMVSPETASTASEECERMLRMGDRVGRPGYDRKKLLLYAIISGCRHQIDRLLRDQPTLFNTIEDFMWFKLSALRDFSCGSSSIVLSEGLVPYSLEDLQGYLNKFEPSHYTKNGKDPLVYPYVLLLSIQLLPAILYLSKEVGDEGYNVDSVHISIVLADQGRISEGTGITQKMGVMDPCAETASIIRQYGSLYLHQGNLSLALEYYAQAAAAMGGGELSWIFRARVDHQRQRDLMLKQLLTDILLRDGGIFLLLGPRGIGEEGELRKYFMDLKTREQFLLEAAAQCQEAGLYDKTGQQGKLKFNSIFPALSTFLPCKSRRPPLQPTNHRRKPHSVAGLAFCRRLVPFRCSPSGLDDAPESLKILSLDLNARQPQAFTNTAGRRHPAVNAGEWPSFLMPSSI
ncbi:hypothetical protein KSP40_PGU016910 [Platanthera guangdongensis]|uniref:Nuclear pore protein n=1 Tax=Platanthera guangdongensis TaxID=2320717 RepID=A0ABR2MBS1_9ASPA